MVFLSLMAQEHLDEIYDYSACTLDQYKIQQIIKNCKEYYSERLVNIVERLIVERPEDRLTLRSVLNKLSYKLEVDNKIEMEILENNEEHIDYLQNSYKQ